jgi:hypothetical protein
MTYPQKIQTCMVSRPDDRRQGDACAAEQRSCPNPVRRVDITPLYTGQGRGREGFGRDRRFAMRPRSGPRTLRRSLRGYFVPADVPLAAGRRHRHVE